MSPGVLYLLVCEYVRIVVRAFVYMGALCRGHKHPLSVGVLNSEGGRSYLGCTHLPGQGPFSVTARSISTKTLNAFRKFRIMDYSTHFQMLLTIRKYNSFI